MLYSCVLIRWLLAAVGLAHHGHRARGWICLPRLGAPMPMNCLTPGGHPFALLAAAADGLGELDFASEAWVAAAESVLRPLVTSATGALAGVSFTLCEVAHNAPVYLHAGSKLAWHARIEVGEKDGRGGVQLTVGAGEVADADLLVEGDHSVMSNCTRIQHAGRDPGIVAQAEAIIARVGRFRTSGTVPSSPAALAVVLREFRDRMAALTLPKFPWMSPPWVAVARQYIHEQALAQGDVQGLAEASFVFAEEFRNPPRYVSPDAVNGGFWVVVRGGLPEVGHGPLPPAHGAADKKTEGEYAAVLPVGRTVHACDTEADTAAQAEYSRQAFAKELAPAGERSVISVSSPSRSGKEMPAALKRIMAPIHDELSRRSTGCMASDFEDRSHEPPIWHAAQPFDRTEAYDAS